MFYFERKIYSSADKTWFALGYHFEPTINFWFWSSCCAQSTAGWLAWFNVFQFRKYLLGNYCVTDTPWRSLQARHDLQVSWQLQCSVINPTKLQCCQGESKEITVWLCEDLLAIPIVGKLLNQEKPLQWVKQVFYLQVLALFFFPI